MSTGDNHVIWTLDNANRTCFRFSRSATTVWLRADPEDHMQRVIDQGDHRPMADRDTALAELRALLTSREPFYKQAQISVNTSKATVPAVVSSLTGSLAEIGWRIK